MIGHHNGGKTSSLKKLLHFSSTKKRKATANNGNDGKMRLIRPMTASVDELAPNSKSTQPSSSNSSSSCSKKITFV